MTPVRLEPAALRSQVKHSTTEPLRSIPVSVISWCHSTKITDQLFAIYASVDGNEVDVIFDRSSLSFFSALDKLLGQLGIYATWLSSMHTCKNNCVFSFFYATFFFCDYTFSYCMEPSGMGLHINSLQSSAFLKYQTSVFNCT